MTNLPIKRRSVVMAKPGSAGDMWSPYGRVNRFINNEYVEVIDCSKHVVVYHIDEVEAVDYDGRWDTAGAVREKFPVFVWMPSMRKLKQMRAHHDKLIWKKNRKYRKLTKKSKR